MNRPIQPHPVNPSRPRPLPAPRPNPPTNPRPRLLPMALALIAVGVLILTVHYFAPVLLLAGWDTKAWRKAALPISGRPAPLAQRDVPPSSTRPLAEPSGRPVPYSRRRALRGSAPTGLDLGGAG